LFSVIAVVKKRTNFSILPFCVYLRRKYEVLSKKKRRNIEGRKVQDVKKYKFAKY